MKRTGYYLQDKQWYPEYPDLGATVARYRRRAAVAGSIKEMLRADVVAYADAIEKAIRARHRTLHMKPVPAENGGWYTPPSIARLLKYENPLPMAGDPDWHRGDQSTCPWHRREQSVYAAMMTAKRSNSHAAD